MSSSLGIDSGLMYVDREKAFDRVEHRFLWKVRFGFGPGFLAMICVLYIDVISMLTFNGRVMPFLRCSTCSPLKPSSLKIHA